MELDKAYLFTEPNGVETKPLTNGTIILYKTYGFIGRAIRKVLDSPVNHAGIYFDGCVYESLGKGVVKEKISIEVLQKQYQVEFFKLKSCNEFREKVCRNRAEACVNVVKYDRMALLFYGVWYKLTGYWLGGMTADRMTCSEFVAFVYYEYFPYWYKTTPKDIYESPYFEKVDITSVSVDKEVIKVKFDKI